MKHLKPILACSAATVTAALVWATAVKTDYLPIDRYRQNVENADCARMNVSGVKDANSIIARGADEVSSLPTIRKTAENTPLYTWDFSGCTAGSEDAPDGTEIGELDYTTYVEGPIDAKYMGEEGWKGMGVFQAGGMVLLDSKATIYGMADLITPKLSTPAKFTVQVKVRSFDNKDAAINFAAVTPNPKDPSLPNMKQTNNPISGEWKTVNAVFTYNEPQPDLELQILAMTSMFIDEVKIFEGEVLGDSDFTPDADITHPEDAEIVIKEDFSRFTEGSIEEPTAENLTTNWIIDSKYTEQPGWSGNNVSMAGGAAALVNNLDRGLNTFPTDLSGHVTVTFRIYSYETITPIYCSLMREPYSANPELLGQSYSRIRTKGRWTWMRYEFDNTDGSEDCYIQFRPFARCLIDDITVSTQNTLIAEPRLMPASDFTIDGFTANWGSVKKAEDYLLTVFKEEPKNPGEECNYTESFEEFANAVPEGWVVNSAKGDFISDEAADGAASIRLTSNGDYIELPENGGSFLKMATSMRAFGGKDDMEFYNPHIYMEVFDGYRWSEVAGFWVLTKDAWASFTMDNDAAGARKVRLKVRNLADENDYLLIDNIRWTTTSETERIYELEDKVVTDNFYRLENLDPTADYFYTVKARNTALNLVSTVTAAQDAFGVAAPVATEATDISSRGAFTANWQNVPKATGYGIKTYSVYTAKENESDYAVMEENFNRIRSNATPLAPESLGNTSLIPLNELTDNDGWYGYMTIISDGALGAMSMPDYGVRGELQTPELSLSNNGGTCHVDIMAYVAPGDRVIIMNSKGDGLALEGTGDYIQYYGDIYGCGENEVLTFYSEQYHNFLIYSMTVTQDLKEGDRVATLMSTESTVYEEFRATGLPIDMDYAYDVYSRYTRYASTCYSPLSNRIFVPMTSGVEEMAESHITLTLKEQTLIVNTPQPVTLTVSGTDGINIIEASCPAGESSYQIASPGIYLVKAGEKCLKIAVK